ncbi:hypothetical protein J1N35_034725 [Gossypium stocksii]|uniref:Aminotransferase-like plant mobile domain-containing protein n=1 Tax=Gossypium stocksii TaxID=47602 RepID=A0A9D3UT34_9ROSI|nr:hypothetical protein J1N35_034725 [Gossypium stocksii]
MAVELIRLNKKHISVEQMKMSVDRVLQCYIRNMPGPPSLLIENYLLEAGFWHVATIGRDIHLQLGLPVDGYVVTGSTSSADWDAVCYELLGAIPDNINGGRIEIGWLRDTFLEPDNDLTELERIRYARAYILEMIGGYLMPDLSRNLVHPRWLLKLVDFRAAGELSWGSAVFAKLYKEMCEAMLPNKAKIRGCLSLLQSWAWFCFLFLRPRVDRPYTFPLITRWNHSASYVGIPTSLEDIRLLLDQRSDVEIEYYDNLDFDNRFPWRPRCSMMSTKSTYGNCIRIARDTGHTISKCGKIGFMTSHIYYRKRRDDDKFVLKGIDGAL